MPAPFFYLRADERVLLQQRAAAGYALVLLTAPVLGLSALLAAGLTVRALFPDVARVLPAWPLWTGWGALLLLVGLVAWRRAATTEHALTDQRIYVRVGRLVTQIHFTTHDKVTDIRYRQGPLERMLGLASLTFATAGAEVRVPGIRDALALKAASESARDSFIRTLLLEAPVPVREAGGDAVPASAAARPAPPPVAPPVWSGPRPDYLQSGDAPVWFGRPRPIAAIGALRSLLGLIPLLFVMGALDAERRAYAGIAGVALVGIFIAVRVAQIRRTEYVATDKRVYSRHGLVGTTVSQLTYDKITDITYSQDLLGRLLGYGTVRVQTAGSGQAPISMFGLADPLAAKEAIERWRDASLGSGR